MRDERASASFYSAGSNSDIAEGLIDAQRGDIIARRFRVLKTCGQGTFGTVLDCVDMKYGDRVAVKCVRSVPRYLDAADVEVDILERILRKDPNHRS